LAQRALHSEDSDRSDQSVIRVNEPEPVESAENFEKEEDQNFVQSTARTKSSSRIGLVAPAVDFGYLKNPQRLDDVREIGMENEVAMRQGFALPRDSSFRRSLGEPQEGDPLGSASPGIDITEVKAEVASRPDKGSEHPLHDDGIMGGRYKFPTFRHRAAKETGQHRAQPTYQWSTGRNPPKRAKSEDLSDLLRPKTETPRKLGTAEWPDPASDNDWKKRPQTVEALREHQNAAIAMQRLLHKHLKQHVKKRYP